MIFNPDRVTLLLIGPEGKGKSSVGNAYLQMYGFEIGDLPVICTLSPEFCQNIVNGALRTVIDTPGYNDEQPFHNEQLIDSL